MSELLAVLSNPKRRRRRKKKAGGGFQRVQQLTARRRSRRRRSSTIIQSVRHHGRPVARARWRSSGYRRNPRGISVNALGNDLVAAAAGAVGGVALDLVMRPMPLMIKGGPLNHLVRGAVAIGLGIVGQLVKLPYAGELARGAMTVTLYNAARQYVLLPRGLGELTDEDVAALSEATVMDPGYEQVGEVIDMPALSNQMGEVLEGLGAGDELYSE